MGKKAFVFPGQGAQYVGMGREILEAVPAAARVFHVAGETMGYDLQEVCLEGPVDKLKQTVFTQPAVLATSLVCLEAFSELGIKPDMVAGHSLGEYSALVAAGVMDFKTAFQVVRQRARFMEEAVPAGQGAMAAILGLDDEAVAAACRGVVEGGVVEPANYNCPGQVVISGHRLAVELACQKARELGAKRTVMLEVSGPFHSSLMEPAAARLAEVLGQACLEDASLPVVANVSAQVVTTPQEIRDSLKKQVRTPVFWRQSVEFMARSGVDLFIEVGPGKVLSGLIRKMAPAATVLNIEDSASLQKTLATLNGGG